MLPLAKPTKEIVAENMKTIEMEQKDGVKLLGIYWTLGRYDAVGIYEAPDEKVAMKAQIRRGDNFSAETLVAIPAEEARKLV
jgi:uncharacterized protein with GYD domain